MSCKVRGMEQTSSPGRPRSEQARRAVLDAAMRLVRRDGYPAVTIKGIAEEAGVGRQTVYRWWTSKAAILLEAVVELARAFAQPAPTGDAEDDLRRLLHSTFALSDEAGPVISGLLAEATGQLGDEFDIALVTDMIWGTMWYRILAKHAPVDTRLADELTGAAVRLLGRGPEAAGQRG
jgi:AcrR family transcriptional regulator